MKHLIILFSILAISLGPLASAHAQGGEAAPPDSTKHEPGQANSQAGGGGVSTNSNATNATPATKTISNVVIKSITADASNLVVATANNDTTWTLTIKDAELKVVLKTFYVEDRVDITYAQNKTENELKTITVQTHTYSTKYRILAFVLVALGIIVLFRILIGKKLPNLILGIDNRYSNSKFQILIWFFTLLVTYILTSILRGRISIDFVGGIDIPSNLLMLSGLSALTFATAKGITESKQKEAQTTAGAANTATTNADTSTTVNLSATTTADTNTSTTADVPVTTATAASTKDTATVDVKTVAKNPSFPNDLFRDDAGNIDIANFQMIIFTFLAVITYIVQVFGFLGIVELHKTVSLPDIDSTILATFGLGHGAYLAKKLVSNPRNSA